MILDEIGESVLDVSPFAKLYIPIFSLRVLGIDNVNL